MQFRTIACLPVLTGAWRHRGGGLARSTHALHFAVLDMKSLEMPEVHVPGVRTLNMRDLGKDLCDPDLSPPMRALIVYGANPVVSMPNQARIREGLQRDDLFTVVHDLFVTDTALYADYVLPATSQIEHLDLSPAWGHLYLALNRPAIAPRGESMSNTELFRRLAGALGRTEPWLFESDESMLRGALASGHPWLEGITYERLWNDGHAPLNRPEDWRPFADGGFPTAIGQGRALLRSRCADAGHRPAAVSRRHPARQRPSAHLREDAPLPELRLRPHGTASPARGRPVHRGARRRCARAESEGWRAGARVLGPRGGAGALPHLGSSPPRRRLDALRWPSRRVGVRHSVNLLTAEEPTDWGGGSGLYDAFVEVAPAASRSST